MKKNSLKIFILILLVGFGVGSCSYFLEPEHDNQFDVSRFKNDPIWSLGMLINAYLSASYMTANPYNEVATDDAVTNDLSSSYYSYLLMAQQWSPLYYNGNVWTSGYSTILNMNYFLTNVVNTTQWSTQDTIRKRMFRQRYTGEAYAWKGYTYFRLMQQFAGKGPDGTMWGVPLVSTLLGPKDDWRVQRDSFNRCIKEIYTDINNGVKLMPYRFRDIPNASAPADLSWNRVNGVAANLNLLNGERANVIKAQTALLAASPAFYDGVNYNLVHADSAVQIVGRMVRYNGGFTATLAKDPLYWDDDQDGDGNPEIIWRGDYATNNSLEGQQYPPSLTGTGKVNPTQDFVDCFPTLKGYPITYPDTTVSGYLPHNPYASRDPRLNMIVLFNGGRERIYGSVGSNNQINTQADNTANIGVNDGLNKQQAYSTRTGYYLKKGLRVVCSLTSGSTSSARHYYARARWTEMLLIYAECANEKYGPDVDPGYGFTARDVIAGIRKRGYQTYGTAASSTYIQAGITQPDLYLNSIASGDKVGMRALIRNERRIELSFEGYRFGDLRRWMVPLSVLAAPAKGVSITGDATHKNYDYSATSVNPVELRKYGQNAYYGPIPFNETIKYPGFIQNAGW